MASTRQWISKWLKNWYISSVVWALVGIGWLVLFLLDHRGFHIITALASFIVGLMFFVLARYTSQ